MKLCISCFNSDTSMSFTEEVTIPKNSVLNTPELAAASLRTMYENTFKGLEVVGITQVIEVERGFY